MKTILLAFTVIATLILAVSGLVLTSTAPEIYPDTLPAGYCLITDGTKFSYSYPFRLYDGSIVRICHSSQQDTPKEAVDWAWTMREYHAAGDKPWRPVSPELCKEGVK